MSDQGIEFRPAFGVEDGGDRALVGGVTAQAIDSLGREGDQPAGAQEARGFVDRGGRRLDDLYRAALLRAMKCGLEKFGLP